MTKTSNIIAEKSEYLGKLFDKMIETTFSLVREDSEAMRLHIFSQNDVGKTKTTGEEKDKVDTSENSNLDTSII